MSMLNLFPARVRFVNADGTLTSEASRALADLMVRVGGVLAPTIDELDAQQYSDAGIEEAKAFAFALAGEFGALPLPVPAAPCESAAPVCEALRLDVLATEVHELRETVAQLRTEIDNLKATP